MKPPDTRAWVLLGLLALTFYILGLLAWKPELQNNTLFVMLATAIVAGGLIGSAVPFYFGTTKGSAAKDETIASLAQPPSPPAP